MPTFGYDEALGYIPATGPALRADIASKYDAATTGNVDTDNGPVADNIDALNGVMLDAWQDAQGVYNSKHITAAPGTGGVAGGSALELQLSPKIGPKLAAQQSTVTLPLFAAPGPAVNVPALSGVTIDGETTPWQLVNPVIIPGGGSIDGEFAYSVTGPKQAPGGTGWNIQTPVTGWIAVGPNVDAAIPGRNIETDDEYRVRYQRALVDEIYDKVARVAGVSSVQVAEDTDAGTVQVIVVGGDDQAIGEAINLGKAKGVTSTGPIEVIIPNIYYPGGQTSERFARPTPIATFVKIKIIPGQGYPADNSAAAVLERQNATIAAVEARFALLVSGESISGHKLETAAQNNAGIPGIDDIEALVDIVSPPAISGTLTPAPLEQLTVLPVNIDVTEVP